MKKLLTTDYVKEAAGRLGGREPNEHPSYRRPGHGGNSPGGQPARTCREGKEPHPARICTLRKSIEYDLDTASRRCWTEYCARAATSCSIWPGSTGLRTTRSLWRATLAFPQSLLETLKQTREQIAHRALVKLHPSHAHRPVRQVRLRQVQAGRGGALFRVRKREPAPPWLVYRFPNLFGKWCRPNYNSVVATFCHNVSHDLPIHGQRPQHPAGAALHRRPGGRAAGRRWRASPHRCDYEGLMTLF